MLCTLAFYTQLIDPVYTCNYCLFFLVTCMYRLWLWSIYVEATVGVAALKKYHRSDKLTYSIFISVYTAT